MKKASIKTIAEKTGVSITTVSRIINRKIGNYSKKTEEKVIKAIDELNYYPNLAARGLRNQKTRMIGFLTHYLTYFWMEFFKGAMYESFNRGFLLILADTEHSEITENSYVNLLISNNVSGVIVSTIVSNEYNIERLSKHNIPIVKVVDQFKKIKRSLIKIDSSKAIVEAIRHLKEQGYKSVGFITPGIENTLAYNERFKAYRKGLDKYGYKFKTEYLLINDLLSNLSMDYGYEFMKEIIKNRMLKAESYIIIPDSIAVGCMRAIKEGGYKIPQDIGIIGFDNITMSDYTDPRLTTIEIPKFSMGKQAVDILLDMIDSGEAITNVNYKLELIIRDSTNRKLSK